MHTLGPKMPTLSFTTSVLRGRAGLHGQKRTGEPGTWADAESAEAAHEGRDIATSTESPSC